MELVLLRGPDAWRAAQAVRAVDRPRAEALDRVAQAVILDPGRRRARRGFSRL
jgi:hypothetical protein